MEIVKSIERPLDILDNGLPADLLWSDPADVDEINEDVDNWEYNHERGVSYRFGRKQVDEFLQRFDFELVIRAHMIVQDGYQFFNDRKLITIFSAPNYYCGEFGM